MHVKSAILVVFFGLVLVAVLPVVSADCQLALTTFYNAHADCQGQSGCSAGLMKDGCNKLGDQWLQVSCESQSVLVYSTQECGGSPIGTLLDGSCKGAPNPIPLAWEVSWGDSCSGSTVFKWTDYLYF